MKSLLILILTVALAGGAWLSKPSEESFREMVRKNAIAGPKEDRTIIDVILKRKDKTQQFLADCKFKDHVLWVTVEKDGRSIYTGAFGNWFASDLKAEKPAT
jgi:hypothetical protein